MDGTREIVGQSQADTESSSSERNVTLEFSGLEVLTGVSIQKFIRIFNYHLCVKRGSEPGGQLWYTGSEIWE